MLIRSTFLIFLLSIASACTNSEQQAAEPTDEQVNAEGEGEGEGGAESEEGAGELTGQAPEAPLDSPTPPENEILTNDTPTAPIEEVPADQTAPGNAAAASPTSQAAAPAPVAGRVVRYAANDTPILSGPNAGASQVSTLKKGESVLIEDLGAFGKIAEGKFVAKEALSETVVPKDSTPNPWK